MSPTRCNTSLTRSRSPCSARFQKHREAKGQVQRWYDGYRIVTSEVNATYGDGRLPQA
ncbi:hypothetical protein [Intrasporangium mesophilum]